MNCRAFIEDVPEEILATALKGLITFEKEKYFRTKQISGFESISECPKVTSELLVRGYDRGQVKKIMGRNWLRLYKEVWQ
jgi:microsomal dipeptidase-like Zn-dependent dipeptidase